MSTEFWEPEDLVAKLTVGARVRIRLSGECEVQGTADSDAVARGTKGHPSELNGRVGVIRPDLPHDYLISQGHRYEVHFDEPYLGGQFCCTALAAIELEPLDD